MAILSKGTDFSTGDQVTAVNLDALVDSATFAAGAVDNTTTALDSSSPQKIIVKNGGIGTTQLATGDSTTTGVTFAKMQYVAANTVLVRDASSTGDISAKAVTNTQILIGDGTGFTAAALSGDATMTNAGAVTIANDAVTNAKLADDAVNSAQIADGAIDLVHMSANSVDSDQYVDGSIDLVHMSSNSVDSNQYVDGSIDKVHLATEVLQASYPVGSIYMNASDSRNPSNAALLGFGTWAAFGAGQVPVGINSGDNDFDAVGSGQNTNETTGAKTVTLNVNQIPSHTHGVTTDSTDEAGFIDSANRWSKSNGSVSTNRTVTSNSTGGGQSHTNLQPYVVVYMWKRTN